MTGTIRLLAVGALAAIAVLLVSTRDRLRARGRQVIGKAKQAWGRRRGEPAEEVEGQVEEQLVVEESDDLPIQPET